jgi:hypothetical protein
MLSSRLTKESQGGENGPVADNTEATRMALSERWKRARKKTQLLRWRREALVAVVVGPLSYVALELFGSDTAEPVDSIVLSVVIVVVVLVLLPVCEFIWNFAWAPWFALKAEVAALGATPTDSSAPKAPKISVRLTALDKIRQWNEIQTDASLGFVMGSRARAKSAWVDGVIKFLSGYVPSKYTEQFIKGDEDERIRVLEEVADKADSFRPKSS